MNDIYVGSLVSSNHLEHHGIKGMRWGVRRKLQLKTSSGKRNSTNKEDKTSNKSRFRRKTMLKAGAAAVAFAIGAYGGYKLSKKFTDTGASKVTNLFKENTYPNIPRVHVERAEIPRTSIPRAEIPRTSIPRAEIPGLHIKGTNTPIRSFKDMTIDDLKKMDLW